MDNVREEIRRCKNGHEGLTGHEYFYYNYIKIDGKAPLPDSYREFDFEKYNNAIRSIRNMERNIMVPKNISEYPITVKESFNKCNG